jgi:hypothetical protein
MYFKNDKYYGCSIWLLMLHSFYICLVMYHGSCSLLMLFWPKSICCSGKSVWQYWFKFLPMRCHLRIGIFYNLFYCCNPGATYKSHSIQLMYVYILQLVPEWPWALCRGTGFSYVALNSQKTLRNAHILAYISYTGRNAQCLKWIGVNQVETYTYTVEYRTGSVLGLLKRSSYFI